MRVALRIRILVYCLVALGASALIWWAIGVPASAIPAIVQALATIALAVVAAEALLANRELVNVTQDQARATHEEAEATKDEAAATRDEAVATLKAVEATTAATTEQRRLAVLAGIPYLSMDVPEVYHQPPGSVLQLPIRNLGPGPALQVRMDIEVCRGPSPTQFVATLHDAWPLALLLPEAATRLEVNAEDLRNIPAPNVPRHPNLVRPDLLPDYIRIELAWMSTLGARAEQVFQWNVRTPESAQQLAWEFVRMSLDPGTGNGATITFEKPPFP